MLRDNWSSGDRKRHRETEQGDDPRYRRVAATLSGDEVNSLNRDEVAATTAQYRFLSAGAAYESLLQVSTCGEVQHLPILGQHPSGEDIVQRHQINSLPFQPNIPYSAMLHQQQQQQQQQQQIGNRLSEAAMASVFISMQARQAQMLQGLTSGLSSHLSPLTSGLSHLSRHQVHLPIAPEPNATQVSQAQVFEALSESEILQQFQHIQQRQQGISSVASENETYMQQQQQLLPASPPVENFFTAPLVSQAEMAQALFGSSALLQHSPTQQGLFSTAAVGGSSVQQVLQLPVTSPSNVYNTPYETSQAQIIEGLLQHIQSQQELSSTATTAAAATATESYTQTQEMQVWQQNLALLAARGSALRMSSGMVDQIAPFSQDVRANTRPVAFTPPSLPTSSGITMWLPGDHYMLSEYQVTVRQHLEIFEAEQEDFESNNQGRKRQVVPGQAGIRCRHCSNLPLRNRGRGAVYFPLKLSYIYQAAQNMASIHLSDCCSQIPSDVKQKLRDLRHRRDTALGGKKYWAEAGSASGLYETEEGLRLRPGRGAAAP
jgi:hypothetical protein